MLTSLDAGARLDEGFTSMNDGDNPAGGQDYDIGQGSGFGSAQPYPGQPGYAQPGFGAPLPGSQPPTYRVWGIVAIIGGVLFNLILGVPTAVIARRHAGEVPGLWANGDVQGAIKASRKARGWLIASTVLDALGVLLAVLVVIAHSQPNYNTPSVVAASIKTQVQQEISDKSGPYYTPGVTVVSVVCTKSGTDTDYCVDKLSNGQSGSVTEVISDNGEAYAPAK
jgi:hypothetical protein